MAVKKLKEDTAADWVKPVVMYLNKNADGRRKRLDVIEQLGVGSDYFTCYICGEVKLRDDFYVSSDPRSRARVTRICKACARNIAMPEDPDTGKRKDVTKDSLQEMLEYLDKPFLNEVYQKALSQATKGDNLYEKFIIQTTISTGGMRYNQSDMFTHPVNQEAFLNEGEMPKDKEILDQFEKNKADVIRLIGYEPFAEERINDQPFLYSQLVGFLDSNEDGNEDMMRVQACISIVRGFLQMQNLDNRIAKLMADPTSMEKNTSTIKSLQTAKRDLSQIITQMAAENCISMKNNKNANKGENTFTGKIKRLKEMNLREAEINSFDVETCQGMRQVMDMSHASILKQLRLDENDYAEMLADQREMIEDLQNRVRVAEEQKRILYRENLDLKNYCRDKGIQIDKYTEPELLLSGDSNE